MKNVFYTTPSLIFPKQQPIDWLVLQECGRVWSSTVTFTYIYKLSHLHSKTSNIQEARLLIDNIQFFSHSYYSLLGHRCFLLSTNLKQSMDSMESQRIHTKTELLKAEKIHTKKPNWLLTIEILKYIFLGFNPCEKKETYR